MDEPSVMVTMAKKQQLRVDTKGGSYAERLL